MSSLRTMNRRRWRKANPASWAMTTHSLDATGQMRSAVEAIRAGRWVRFSPHPRCNFELEDQPQ